MAQIFLVSPSLYYVVAYLAVLVHCIIMVSRKYN